MRKAAVDGQLINLMDDGDWLWDQLRKERPRIACIGCNGGAHTRERRIGDLVIRMFVHNPGQAERCRFFGGVESPEHELLKEAIVRSARAGGWDADIEVIAPDEKVRADVVCRRGSATHSWEAQLATLNYRDAVERHERYVHAFENTTWVHTRRRDWSKAIPCVRVDEETQATVVGGVYVDDRAEEKVPQVPLASLVPRIMSHDGIHYILDEFGFYRDVKAGAGKPKKRPRQPRQRMQGTVYSTTDCPREDSADTDVLTLLGEVVWRQRPAKVVTEADKRWWSRRAMIAAAKHVDGVPLDDVDREAMRRRWPG